MTDPDKVSFSKYDPETGTVVEFEGPGGAKVDYDGPHDSRGLTMTPNTWGGRLLGSAVAAERHVETSLTRVRRAPFAEKLEAGKTGGRVTESYPWRSAQDAAAKVAGTEVLRGEPFDRIVHLAVARFLRESKSVWWWTRLSFSPTIVPYCGSEEFFPKLRRLVSDESRAILLVMGDQGMPDGAIEGSFGSLVSVIEDSAFFEFVILHPAGDWAIFDTHHNELLISGSPT